MAVRWFGVCALLVCAVDVRNPKPVTGEAVPECADPCADPCATKDTYRMKYI